LSAATPLYVCAVRPEDNSVVVGTADSLYAKALIARDINLIPVERLDGAMKVHARIRYNQREQPATVWQLDSDTLRIEFDSPQKAITKGQAAVLYDGETVIGGGTIHEVYI
jgi:tRNA-specific 2-thiouridylase